MNPIFQDLLRFLLLIFGLGALMGFRSLYLNFQVGRNLGANTSEAREFDASKKDAFPIWVGWLLCILFNGLMYFALITKNQAAAFSLVAVFNVLVVVATLNQIEDLKRIRKFIRSKRVVGTLIALDIGLFIMAQVLQYYSMQYLLS